MYGIWTYERESADWVRASYHDRHAVLAFETKQAACDYAAEHLGFDTYTEAKRKGWCEVRRLPTTRLSGGRHK